METLAIISQLFTFAIAAAAVILCVYLFRHNRQPGWLLLAAVFLEPFALLAMRAARGGPLLHYATTAPEPVGPEGALQITLKFEFPAFYIIALIGLILLVRETRSRHAKR